MAVVMEIAGNTIRTVRRRNRRLTSASSFLLFISSEMNFPSGPRKDMTQVSQFEAAVNKYRPDWTPEDLKKAKGEMQKEQPKKDGHYVEAFRYATGFVQY
jgi:hypothetical protein